MISLTEMVLRLRQQCPIFERRVGGTAAFSEAVETDSSDLPVPHAFIIPAYGADMNAVFPDADDNPTQLIRQFFGVVVCVDNSVDRGKSMASPSQLTALDKIVEIQDQIDLAFMDWKPVQRFDPVRYSRDNHMRMNNKRLWHMFEYFVSYERNPQENPGLNDQIAEIVDEVDEVPPWQGSIGQIIEQLFITYHTSPQEFTDSLRDFWPKKSTAFPEGDDGDLDAGDAARTAKQEAADVTSDVPIPHEGGPIEATHAEPPEPGEPRVRIDEPKD